MLLWIIFAVLTALVLLALLWPLSRPAPFDTQGQRSAFDAEIYKDQLAEIEQDEARGLISAEEAASARNEISRRLLEAARQAEAGPGGSDGARSAHAVPARLFYGTAAVVPTISVGLYLLVGTPGLPGLPFAERATISGQVVAAGGAADKEAKGGDVAAGGMSERKIKSLIARVEAILRDNPQDGRGWAVIAPVYLRQGRYDEAVDAFQKALALTKPTASLLSGYGEALRLAGQGVISEEARKAYSEALAMDSSLVVPKIALALARAQDGQFAPAAADLRKLLADSDKDAPWRPMVEQQIAAFEARAAQIRQRVAQAATGGQGGDGGLPRGSRGGPQTSAGGGLGGPSAEDIRQAQAMTAQDRAAMINQMVEGLAEKLKQNGRNLPGWLRLIQSYKVLNRDQDAARALQAARENFKDDAASLAKLAALAKRLGLGV